MPTGKDTKKTRKPITLKQYEKRMEEKFAHELDAVGASVPKAKHDEMVADAFERGRKERTLWYEQHIREQFVEGPGGTKALGALVPKHVRDMYGSLSEAIGHHVESIQRKADLWDKRDDLIKEVESHKEEPWVPKVGELVFPSDRAHDGWNTSRLGEIKPGIVTKADAHQLELEEEQMKVYYTWRFRPATSEEIAAFQQAEKEREWEPRIDDLVVMVCSEENYLRVGEVCRVLEYCGRGHQETFVQSVEPSMKDGRWYTSLKKIRKATPEEISAEEARIKREKDEEKRKALVLGARVKTPLGDGSYWYPRKGLGLHRIAYSDGTYRDHVLEDLIP